MPTREEIAAALRKGLEARRAGRLTDALQLMSGAAAMCSPDQDSDKAIVLRELGELARNSSDLDAAQARYEESVTLMRNADVDSLKLAHTIRHLGDVHAERKHWSEADRCFAEALGIYRSHPAPGLLDLANAIRAYAALKTATGQVEAARPLWVEAGSLYESAGIAAGAEECRRNAERTP